MFAAWVVYGFFDVPLQNAALLTWELDLGPEQNNNEVMCVCDILTLTSPLGFRIILTLSPSFSAAASFKR